MMVTTTPSQPPRWLQRWLSRRIPAGAQQHLSHRSIFILPSGFGLLWLLLALLLFLFGTNYQNNLVIGLSLLLGSMFVSVILYSYRNLAGLSLQALPATEVYAGETVAVPLKLSAMNQLYQVQFGYPVGQRVTASTISAQPQTIALPLPTVQRGWLQPGRLLIESRFPLGLCRVWSWVDLDNPLLVYPAQQPAQPQLQGASDDGINANMRQPGIDEFSGLKSWHLGESLKQVAWKQYAQGRGMLSKEFADPQGQPVWLQLPAHLDAMQLEEALRQLCWQVDTLTRQQRLWGLKLPQKVIAPAAGDQHRRSALTALALYQPPPELCDE
ncbi:DUF58 domain-containing protein [Shewanella dokdonensis]|nr:DUF58 domain-containing protein [Shewanella dokdonensis]MCL1076094.1 DUF58 domain-containing protein [Shewanella dokdonensis]